MPKPHYCLDIDIQYDWPKYEKYFAHIRLAVTLLYTKAHKKAQDDTCI